MKQLFKGQISCKAVFSKQARDSYYHGILAATDRLLVLLMVETITRMRMESATRIPTYAQHKPQGHISCIFFLCSLQLMKISKARFLALFKWTGGD